MSEYAGDFAVGSTVNFTITTNAATGAAVAPSSAFEAADLIIYKGSSATQRSSAAGVTMTSPFDSITGLHMVSIDTTDNTDAGFWVAGADYHVILSPDTETVDSVAVVKEVFHFSIENRSNSRMSGVVASGTLSGTHSTTTADLGTAAPSNDIAGQTLFIPTHNFSRVIDSYNTSTGVATFSPATAVTLANGNQWYLFASAPGSTGAPPAANATQLAGQTVTAAAGVTFPSSVASPTNITAGTITTATNVTTVNGLAANVITAAATATDFTTEVTNGLATQALLTTVAGYIDTEVAAIKAKTDNLPSDPADASDVAAALATLTTTINTSRYQKNAIAADIPVVMVDSTDHVTRKTGLTLTVTRSIDGGAFGSATGTASEVASGVYMFDASAADMNGNNIVFRFAGTNADPVELHVKTYT